MSYIGSNVNGGKDNVISYNMKLNMLRTSNEITRTQVMVHV